jgi:hypothetical protein
VARLKIEVIISSETPVHIRITLPCILEDGSILNYRCENLKPYVRLEIPICVLQRRLGFNIPGFVIQSGSGSERVQFR